jgi:hypothetical protein
MMTKVEEMIAESGFRVVPLITERRKRQRIGPSGEFYGLLWPSPDEPRAILATAPGRFVPKKPMVSH